MTTERPAAAAGFDVREYTRTAQGSLRAELELAAFESAPIAPEVVRVLAVLRDLEAATMAHLRNVLVTATHKDARVTAFLVTWAFEKFWIADAVGAIVEASGGTPAATAATGSPPGAIVASESGRGPVRRALAGFAQGWPIAAAHMTVGLVDDWMLRAAYDRVVDAAANDALAAAVDRIVAVKARHTRFFDEEARRRLGASPKAARLTRRELRGTALPVGIAALPAAERQHFTRFVFAESAGDEVARLIESRVAELPGMDGRTAAAVRRRLTETAALAG